MDLSRLFILAKDSEPLQRLIAGLQVRGYASTIVSVEEALSGRGDADLLIIEPDIRLMGSALKDITRRIKQERNIPVMLLADRDILPQLGDEIEIEDFIMKPYDTDELAVRIKRLLRKNSAGVEASDYLKAGDVVIDLPRCEVWVRGKIVDLTFTEYELLKLLMSKKGQVLTRETLLNKIWGYDYFGGDRTVDVHITRLRNKIEDTTHNIIETVRNIGYRIKTNEE